MTGDSNIDDNRKLSFSKFPTVYITDKRYLSSEHNLVCLQQ